MILFSVRGIIITLVLLQRSCGQEYRQTWSEGDWDVYQNITSVCPLRELCDGRRKTTSRSFFDGCQCDDMCSFYEDCCRDSPFFVPSGDVPKRNFTCVKVPTRKFGIKMITSCSPDVPPDDVNRTLCESRREDYPIFKTPVTGTEDNATVVYLNIFCAGCNRSPNATYNDLWNSELLCYGGGRAGKKPCPEDAEIKWDPNKKRVIYSEGNWTTECYYKPMVPDNVYSIRAHVNCRKTPFVDYCPEEWADPTVARLCKGYTGQVKRKGVEKMYKNQYCIKCNGGGDEDVSCGPYRRVSYRSKSKGRSKSRVLSESASYTVLLRYVRSNCPHGEHYDPILKECINFFPPRVVNNDTTATPIDTCARAKLPARLYELSPDNSTVTIAKYDRNFTPGYFRFAPSGDLEICEKDIPQQPHTLLSLVIGVATLVGLSLSIFFLVLHLCAVLLVAALRNLSGITLASLCVALLGAYSSFIVGITLRDKSYLSCYTCAIITYVFFMSSFFWTLVLAFDVSEVLRASVRKFRSRRGFKWRRFATYSMVAWGIPILLGVTAHKVEVAVPGSVDDRFRPKFGLQSCWFGNPSSLLGFFLIPLAVIMALNFSFFVYATRVTSENPTGQRKTLRVYVKLIILLGLNWIVGLLASALDNDFLWIVFSILNTLQGLFIFLSFTMTSKVSRGLSKHMPCFEKAAGKPSPKEIFKETSFSTKTITSQESTKN